MRPALLLATPLAILLALSAAALAQTPQPGTASGGQGQVFTPAPVPGVVPGAPSNGGPSTVPEQVAPSGLTAGPKAATPFSDEPSSQLPPSGLPRDSGGGAAAPAPNLGK